MSSRLFGSHRDRIQREERSSCDEVLTPHVLWRINRGFADGGFSAFIDGTLPVYCPSHWIASYFGLEANFSTQPTDDQLRSYVRKNECMLRLPDHCLGGWRAGASRFVLDVSRVFPNFDSALAFAQCQRQEAIYSPYFDVTYQLAIEAA